MLDGSERILPYEDKEGRTIAANDFEFFTRAPLGACGARGRRRSEQGTTLTTNAIERLEVGDALNGTELAELGVAVQVETQVGVVDAEGKSDPTRGVLPTRTMPGSSRKTKTI